MLLIVFFLLVLRYIKSSPFLHNALFKSVTSLVLTVACLISEAGFPGSESGIHIRIKREKGENCNPVTFYKGSKAKVPTMDDDENAGKIASKCYIWS